MYIYKYIYIHTHTHTHTHTLGGSTAEWQVTKTAQVPGDNKQYKGKTKQIKNDKFLLKSR